MENDAATTTDTTTTDTTLLTTQVDTTTATPGPNDWLPSKFHTNNDAGEFDEAASARKLAQSYRDLEAHKGPVMKAPDTPEGYKLTVPNGADGKPMAGVDIDAFMADPMFQGIAKRAHEAGVPAEHMQLFMEEYLRAAPDLFSANAALTLDEASAELSKVWGDKATFDANLGHAHRTVAEFTKGIADDQPGSIARVQEKFGNDPDFVAFAARIGAEVKFGEDTPATNAKPTSAGDLDALMKSQAYTDPNHPDHKNTVEKVYRAFGNPLPK